MRKSSAVLAALAVGVAGGVVTHLPLVWADSEPARLAAARTVMRDLALTDLTLFTEARYTRHPGVADLHSAFQDHPLALDHFPSGSLLGPPPVIRHPPARPVHETVD